jgi:hypothetical protein
MMSPETVSLDSHLTIEKYDLLDPVDDEVVAESEAVASLELATEPFSRIRLSLQGSNLLVDALLEVGSQFPEVFLESSGCF